MLGAAQLVGHPVVLHRADEIAFTPANTLSPVAPRPANGPRKRWPEAARLRHLLPWSGNLPQPRPRRLLWASNLAVPAPVGLHARRSNSKIAGEYLFL